MAHHSDQHFSSQKGGQPENGVSLGISASTEEGPQGVSSGQAAVPVVQQNGGLKEEFHTLVVRNLPSGFDQKRSEAWLQEQGYGQLFPPKSRSPRASYFFVNFVSVQIARKFKAQYHLYRLEQQQPDGSRNPQNLRLNVAATQVQGFNNNYLRFWNVAKSEGSACQPFFAEEAVRAALSANSAGDRLPDDLSAGATGPLWRSTVIIRNLPEHVSNKELAQQWLSEAGLSGHDFFAYLAGRSSVVVNFPTLEEAKKCMSHFDRLSPGDGLQPLSAVWSTKAQGLASCMKAFSSASGSHG
eukprot:CAMPEP_0170573480 /NCGR_PEP_ID=MMETSP0224-20130122/2789_1 /TAXON_ID=285029 /ORGANISM="Togula jolla, Strain CCCM 725" /LENGTH=297 /DNA_ID=CAMNT_0010896073 /DNA_START=1 /DNA_END=894 /DNA_ORIENTATION=+